MKNYFSILVIVIAAIIAFYASKFRPLGNLLKSPTLLRNPLSTTATSTMAAAPSSTFAGLPVIPQNDPSLTAKTSVPRKINKAFEAIEQAEGVGARVRRSIGTRHMKNYSPFLMLDHFSVAPGAGFADHPHRGQETITLALHGQIDHEDFTGARGTISEGGLQFMTAGRGVSHAEMPVANKDGSPVTGLQLWVDLPERLKDCAPRYRDLKAEEIPVAHGDDGKVTVKVISGSAYGVESLQELAYTPVWFLDVTVQPGGTFSQNIPHKWNSFVYTLDGTTTFGSSPNARTIKQYHNVVWDQEGDTIVANVDADAEGPSRFFLLAGMPLDQKIVQYGPFVGVKEEDIHKAMFDYRTYSNGFERARGWESKIAQSLM